MPELPEPIINALNILKPEGEKGPRSTAVAVSHLLGIISEHQERLILQKEGQTFSERQAKLRHLQEACKNLRHVLRRLGPEGLEEILIVGRHLKGKADIAGVRRRLGDIADLDGKAPVDLLLSTWPPLPLSMRVEALETIASAALENPNLRPKPGRGQKPATVGEPSPTEFLVNECWGLLTTFRQQPKGGQEGSLTTLTVAVGLASTGQRWDSERVKREVTLVLDLRRRHQKLANQFDQLWQKHGSPLLRGTLPSDQRLEKITQELLDLSEESKGMIRLDPQITSFKSIDKWRSMLEKQAKEEQNPG